jgi:serine/threonine-protein kinase
MGESPSNAPAPAPPPDLGVPATGTLLLGKYRVEGVIGIGGMGVVVAAFHELLKRRVAMKMLLPELAQRTDVRARFEREAQAAFSLKNEHICRVLDAGQLESGQPFITLEYLKGDDLGAIARQRGKLPMNEAVEYILQACEGLAEAHEQDVVHRDIKPSNLIVVTRRDGTPCLKIIDFGISKLRDDDSGEELTQANAYLGSPLYSSPEQLFSAHAATAKSDLWSLGVILYQLLTGVHPFSSSDDLRQLTNAIRHNEAAPLRLHEASIDPGLEDVMSRCLQKDPAARHASAADLFEALLPFAGPRPTLSLTSSGGYPRFSATPVNGLPAANPFATTAAAATNVPIVVRRPAVVEEEDDSGKVGWVSILALIAAAATVAFVAWRSQQKVLVHAPVAAPPSASIAAAPIPSEVPSASAAPVASSRPTHLPRGSHTPRGAASTTPVKPAAVAPITPSFPSAH